MQYDIRSVHAMKKILEEEDFRALPSPTTLSTSFQIKSFTLFIACLLQNSFRTLRRSNSLKVRNNYIPTELT